MTLRAIIYSKFKNQTFRQVVSPRVNRKYYIGTVGRFMLGVRLVLVLVSDTVHYGMVVVRTIWSRNQLAVSQVDEMFDFKIWSI